MGDISVYLQNPPASQLRNVVHGDDISTAYGDLMVASETDTRTNRDINHEELVLAGVAETSNEEELNERLREAQHILDSMDIYTIFAEKKVPDVTSLRYGGDISGHGTKTSDFLDNNCFNRPMFHHRIVLNEIGLPLIGYQSSKQFCLIIRDALIAHQRAWENAHVLHHDINEHNMIVFLNKNEEGRMTGKGFLLDWDLAKFRNQLDEASDGNRSGTWTYLSAPRLAYPRKPWELADDLESFVHLINCFALRYHSHRMLKPSDLVGHYHQRYESCHYDHQIKAFTGCSQKVYDVMMGTPVFQLDRDPNTNERTNLAIVIDSLIKLCQKHWQSLDAVAVAKYASSNEQPEDTLLCQSIMPDDVLFEEEPLQDSEHDTPSTAEVQPQSPFLDHKEIIKVLKDCLGKRGWPTYVDRTKVDQVVQAKRVYGDLRPIQFAGRTTTPVLDNIGASSSHRIDSLRKTANLSSQRGSKRKTARSSSQRGSKRKAADKYKSASEDDVDSESDYNSDSDFLPRSRVAVAGDDETESAPRRNLKRLRQQQILN